MKKSRSTQSVMTLLYQIPTALTIGFCLSKMYLWFVVPVWHLDAITVTQMGGLYLIYSTGRAITFRSKKEQETDDNEAMSFKEVTIRFVVTNIIFLFGLFVAFIYYKLFI